MVKPKTNNGKCKIAPKSCKSKGTKTKPKGKKK